MKSSHCTHRNFRDIYKAINFHATFSKKNGQTYVCSMCGSVCRLERKGSKKLRKLSIRNIGIYLAWMFPAIVFIYLFLNGKMSAGTVIGLTIIYHICAMVRIINYSPHILISSKK